MLHIIAKYISIHGVTCPGGKLIIERIKDILIRKNLTVSTAESCTGGMISSLLTSIGGASGYFILGFVPYIDEMKISMLGVDPDSIKRNTAVSHEVARDMAEGIRRISGSDIGISTTGYAGPKGGDIDNPIGTVYMAISILDNTITKKLILEGNRNQIISGASERALELLFNIIRKDA